MNLIVRNYINKNGKSNIGLLFDSCFWKENRAAKSKTAWMLYTGTLLLRWRPSKTGLTSFNVAARGFYEPGAPKTVTTDD